MKAPRPTEAFEPPSEPAQLVWHENLCEAFLRNTSRGIKICAHPFEVVPN